MFSLRIKPVHSESETALKHYQTAVHVHYTVYELSQFTVKVKPLWNITRCPLQQKGVELDDV